MKRGISPLLGAMALLAIVMAVTAIVGPSILDFAEEQTGEAADASQRRADCARAGISIGSVICEEVEDSYELSIEVTNTGYQDLADFYFQSIEDGEYVDYTFGKSEMTLRPDDTAVFANDSFDNSSEGGTFFSGACPSTASRDIPPEEFEC